MWMSQSVWGIPLYNPTDADWRIFSKRRGQVPLRAWFGLGIVGCACAVAAAALQ